MYSIYFEIFKKNQIAYAAVYVPLLFICYAVTLL